MADSDDDGEDAGLLRKDADAEESVAEADASETEISDSNLRPRQRRISEDDVEAAMSSTCSYEPKSRVPKGVLGESLAIIKTLLQCLFSTATSTDIFVLLIGTLFAIIHGVTFPFMAVLFGSMTNSFIRQSVSGFANETAHSHNLSSSSPGELNKTDAAIEKSGHELEALIPSQLGGIFDLINKVVLETFTEHEALTKDEFLANVHLTGILFLWLAIVIFVSSFFQVLCWEWVAANQKFQLRESVVVKFLKQDLLWFQKHDIGELIANIFSEVARVRSALGVRFSTIIQHCAMFIISSLIAFIISWRLALIFLAPMPFIVLGMLTLGRKIASTSQNGDALWTNAESAAAEALANANTVVAFNQQLNFINKFGSKLEAAIDRLFKKYHLAALGRGGLAFLTYGTYAVAFWYACRLLLQGKISAGEIYTIFLSITLGTIGLTNIINCTTIVATAYGSACHLNAFGHPLPDHDCFCEEGKCHTVDGEVEFKKVSFDYPGGSKMLDGLSFKIDAGKTVAIVSDVGEGKSTIGKLILRLYAPTRGKIRIDGDNLQKLSLKTLRRNVGIALQQPQTSDPEIDANIKAARGFVRHEDVQYAKYLVDPENMLGQSMCDVKGFPLNDRRKINLARGLAPDPAILILDESFTHLVSLERENIRKRVLEDRKGKTTIILTNDILSLESSYIDKIFILKNGQILPGNIGTHEQLMQTGGVDNIYKLMLETASKLSTEERLMTAPRTMKRFILRYVELIPEPESKPPGILELFDLYSTFRMFALGLIGVVLTGALLAVFAYFFVEMFATFSKTGDELTADSIFWASMLLGLAVSAAVSVWLRILFMSSAGLYVMLNIRTSAFGSILRRPQSYFNAKLPKTTPLALGTEVVHRAAWIKNALENHLPLLLRTTVTLACVGVIVTALVWQIGLIFVLGVFCFLGVLAILQFKFQRFGEDKICEAETQTSDLITMATELMELIQTHSMQKHYLEKYRDAVARAWKETHKQALAFSIIYGLGETLFFVFFGVSFLYGAYLINVDAIQPPSLFKIFFSLAFCVVSFNEIIALMPDFARAVGALEMISDLVREDDEFDSTMDALNDEGEKLEEVKGDIEFSHVHFQYSSEHEVFKGLNLKIPSGETVAITGPTSFGGTTLLALINRFYDVKSGTLSIDYQDIKDLNIRQLRDKIGWVPEPDKISFFNGSLMENIVFGYKDEISLRKLQEVLTSVQLADIFGKSSDLCTSRSRKHWSSLCRGKRVLLGIARVLIRNPKILLLDSPTSSMSREEEMKVISAIKEIKADRTCVLVSRNPATISLADKIIVIEFGAVLEEGTLEELRSNDGYYSSWLKTVTSSSGD